MSTLIAIAVSYTVCVRACVHVYFGYAGALVS